MPVASGLLLSSRPLGTLQWSKGEIRIQSSGSSTQTTTTSRCSGEIAEASFCKGRHNQLRNLMARPDRPVRLQVLLKRYSPKCVEGEFCELRLERMLGSSAKAPSRKLRTCRVLTAVLIRVDPAANSQRGRTNLRHLLS